MKVRTAVTVSAAMFGIALWMPATAAADDITWNPFLFISYCSTCGPQIPLTSEQADARDVLPWADLPGGPVVSDSVPTDPGATLPFVPPPANGGGNPAPPAPGLNVPPSGGNGNGGNGNSGNNGGGKNGGGLDYSITVHPPAGPDGPPGPDGTPGGGPNDNPPTFGLGDGPGGGIDVPTNPTYDGGHEGETTLVPEPTTLLLLGSGLSAAALRRRRGQRIEH